MIAELVEELALHLAGIGGQRGHDEGLGVHVAEAVCPQRDDVAVVAEGVVLSVEFPTTSCCMFVCVCVCLCMCMCMHLLINAMHSCHTRTDPKVQSSFGYVFDAYPNVSTKQMQNRLGWCMQWAGRVGRHKSVHPF